MKRLLLLLNFVVCITLISCYSPRNVIKTTAVTIPNYTESGMIKLIRDILQNQGYEIKNTGEDYLTTEWYQYMVVNDSKPPFDFYIQMRFTLSTVSGKVRVLIAPRIKQINRLNTGAFTESELYVFKFDEYNRDRQRNKITGLGTVHTAYCWGQEYFIDFLNEFSARIKIDKKNFEYKLTLPYEQI